MDMPRLPGPGEEVKTKSFARTVGGGALITSVAFARLGLRAQIVSALGPEAVTRLRRERVRVTNLRRPGEPHAITAALSTRRDRSFATFVGVNAALEPRYRSALARVAARHVHLTFPPIDPALWVPVVERLRRQGVTTSWDFGWDDRLARDLRLLSLAQSVDYLFLNEKEAPLYSGARSLAASIGFWKAHARNAVIKLGRRGSRWISASLDLRAPAPRVTAIDTTGAGDAFDGGFLFGVLSGRSRLDCLRLGNRVGALSTRSAGGVDALPHRKDVL